MNIGVVGNREGWTYQEIEDRLDAMVCPYCMKNFEEEKI